MVALAWATVTASRGGGEAASEAASEAAASNSIGMMPNALDPEW